MNRILQVIVLLAIVWSLACVGRPYWDRYWLGNDMEAVAIYGTKNTLAHTKAFLNQKMKMAGRDFRAEDFTIKKDKNNKTTIRITYEDRIIIFGQVVKTLLFEVERTKREVAAML
jgi:hypothetical protein